MQIRELSLSEVKQVSGAGLDWTRPDCLEIYNAGIAKIEKAATQLDSSHDWRYVAATNDAIKGDFMAFVDYIGAGGKETAAMWAKNYAS